MSAIIKSLVEHKTWATKAIDPGKKKSQNITNYLKYLRKTADNTSFSTLTLLSPALLITNHNLLFGSITLPFRCLSSRRQCYSYENRELLHTHKTGICLRIASNSCWERRHVSIQTAQPPCDKEKIFQKYCAKWCTEVTSSSASPWTNTSHLKSIHSETKTIITIKDPGP